MSGRSATLSRRPSLPFSSARHPPCVTGSFRDASLDNASRQKPFLFIVVKHAVAAILGRFDRYHGQTSCRIDVCFFTDRKTWCRAGSAVSSISFQPRDGIFRKSARRDSHFALPLNDQFIVFYPDSAFRREASASARRTGIGLSQMPLVIFRYNAARASVQTGGFNDMYQRGFVRLNAVTERPVCAGS